VPAVVRARAHGRPVQLQGVVVFFYVPVYPNLCKLPCTSNDVEAFVKLMTYIYGDCLVWAVEKMVEARPAVF